MRQKKRPFYLIEVLIALTLLLFCLAPLVMPHIAERKSQIALQTTDELHNILRNSYTEIVKKLYENQIPKNHLEDQEKHALNQEENFQVSYQFKRLLPRGKIKEDTKVIHYLMSLNIFCTYKNKTEEGEYFVHVVEVKDV